MSVAFFPHLTLEQVIRDIPHDAGAFVTYALLGLFVLFVWLGNRGSAKPNAANAALRPATEPGSIHEPSTPQRRRAAASAATGSS